jgi:hypothetical protein
MIFKKSIFTLFVFLPLCFYGCSTPFIVSSPPTYKDRIVEREEGVTYVVTIGSPILSLRNCSVVQGYEAIRNYVTPFSPNLANKYDIHKGDKFSPFKKVVNKETTLLVYKNETDSSYLININYDGTVANGWVQRSDYAGNVHYTVPTQGIWTKEKLFNSSGKTIVSDIFSAEIIYSGLIGRTLKAVYREYSHDIARPAFYQELQYNLEESKVIAFKTISIEVINATNTSLEYRISSYGDLGWFPKY